MRKTFHLAAPQATVLTAAETVFTALGFAVSARTPESLTFEPTALSQQPRSHYRQVRGLHLKVHGDSVYLDATLPDPKAMENRLLAICVVMEMIFLGVFFLLFTGKLFYLVAIASAASILPVFFLIPRLLRQQHNALSSALDLALMEVRKQTRPREE